MKHTHTHTYICSPYVCIT